MWAVTTALVVTSLFSLISYERLLAMTTPSPIVSLNFIEEQQLLKPGVYLANVVGVSTKKHSKKDSFNINLQLDCSSTVDGSEAGRVFFLLPDLATSPSQGWVWVSLYKAFNMKLSKTEALTVDKFVTEFEYAATEQTPVLVTVDVQPATYFKDSDGKPTTEIEWPAKNKITKWQRFDSARTN